MDPKTLLIQLQTDLEELGKDVTAGTYKEDPLGYCDAIEKILKKVVDFLIEESKELREKLEKIRAEEGQAEEEEEEEEENEEK